MPQPILTVAAVPSEHRAKIRNWIKTVVEPEARCWLSALDLRTATWRDSKHLKRWTWHPDEPSS